MALRSSGNVCGSGRRPRREALRCCSCADGDGLRDNGTEAGSGRSGDPASWPAGSPSLPHSEAALPALTYRQIFIDRRLQALIDQAMVNNRDLMVAAAISTRRASNIGSSARSSFPVDAQWRYLTGENSKTLARTISSASGSRTSTSTYLVGCAPLRTHNCSNISQPRPARGLDTPDARLGCCRRLAQLRRELQPASDRATDC